ncbi:MAG: class F sortase [Propionibacteriaceae bacterium]
MRGEHSERRARPVARRVATLVLALAGLLAVSGCSNRSAPTAPPLSASPAPVTTPTHSGTPAEAATPSATLAQPAPTLISIPAIGVSSTLVRLGLTEDGALEVPTQAMAAGWYTGSPVPGVVGPSVIAGHVHWSGVPGVFAHLADLRPGDRVIVSLSDATTVVFAVDRVASYAKSQFPTGLVYGDIAYPGLRVITCGAYDAVAHAYEANVVVFATRLTP